MARKNTSARKKKETAVEVDDWKFETPDLRRKTIQKQQGDVKGGFGLFSALAVLVILIVVVAMIANNVSNNSSTSNSNSNIFTDEQGRKITNVMDLCINHGVDISTHYHYNLQLLIDNNNIPLRSDLGISDGCMRVTHTHDASGKVHVEMPAGYSDPSVMNFVEIAIEQEASIPGTVSDYSVDSILANSQAVASSYVAKDGDSVIVSLITN